MASKSKRRFLIPIAILLVIVIVLVALMPVMISGGLGHGVIRSAIEDQINGTASFQRLKVTWLGPQSIEGLRIVDDSGREAAVVDASVEQSLFRLLFARDELHATIAGVVHSDWHEDGTLSLQRLVPERPEQDPDEPLNLQGVPEMTVTIAGITAFINDMAGGRELVIEDLSGYFVYVPGGELNFQVQGATESAAMRGTISAAGGAQGLFDSAGRFTPQGKAMQAQLAVSSIPVPGVDVQSVLHNLTLDVQSQDITQLVSMNVQGEGTIQDAQPSRFSGEFRVRSPIQQDGTFDFSLERIEGQLSGERVPSSVLQPAFNNTPIVLTRDVGRTVDLNLQLNPDPEESAIVRAVGELATVELSAVEQEGWWRGDNLVLRTPQAQPALIHGYTGMNVEQATDLEIVLTSWAIPPFDEALDGRPWGYASATGTLRINGPVTVIIPQEAEEELDEPQPDLMRLTVSDAALNIDTAELGDALYIAGSMLLDGGQITLDHTVTNLADESGRIDAAAAEPIGTLTISNMPATLASQLMPEQEDMIVELLGQSLNATVQTAVMEGGLQAQVQASGQSVNINATVLRGADALQLIEGVAQLNVTSDFAQSLLADLMDEPVQLTRGGNVLLELAPAEFPGSPPFDYQWRGVPITGVVSAENLAFDNVPGTQEAVGLDNFRATVDAQLDEQWSFGANGEVRVMRAGPNRRLANVTYNITAELRDQQPTAYNGFVTFADMSLNHVEAVLGQEAGNVTDWVGQRGEMRVDFQTVEQRYEATLTSQLERLSGTFLATLADEILSLDTEQAEINLSAAALQRLLGAEDEPGLVEVVDDVPFALALNSRMPLSLFTEDPYDPQAVQIDAELAGGPLVLVSEGERSTLSDVTLLVRSEPVGDNVDFIINIDAAISESAVTAEAGEIDLQARVSNLNTPEAFFDLQAATIDMDASVVGAPAALADAMLNLRGYFVAAVGRELNATIASRDFSQQSGTLSMDVSTIHGWLRFEGEGRENALAFAEGSPLEGELELTPLLRDGLLGNFHPLLGDIVAMAQPLHLVMSEGALPLDGDISRLNGEIVLSIGEVDFNAGSPMFAMLRAARVADVDRLDGFIAPIRARISDGVISYDQFLVTLGELEIPYRGQIDLNDGAINLLTTLPLGELLVTGIREVPEAARMIIVPLVTRGSLSSFETRIDPEFDLARAMLEAGVQRGLEDIFPRDRLPFDLRDILPRGR